MLELKPNAYMQLWYPVNDDWEGQLEINNTLDESLSLDSQFLYQLIKQAWDDNKDEEPYDIEAIYEFEVPIKVYFNERD